MKVKILSATEYISFPEQPGMVEVDDNDLKLIGRTKKFDIALQKIVDYDSSLDDLIAEKLQWIDYYKEQLHLSDYQAIKFGEGEISMEDYKPIREERRKQRQLINKLEAEIEELRRKGELNA